MTRVAGAELLVEKKPAVIPGNRIGHVQGFL
jgi:hypothetical protein